MNDEIKKALEEINILGNTILNDTTYKPTINRREALYNYITNLQQELKIMIKDDERSQETIIRLTKENEKLKNGYCELKVKCNNGECDCTNEEYEGMVQANMKLSLEIDDYKSRCKKAIEYINNNKHLSMFADCREPEEDWNYDLECSANDLLNILQNGGLINE